MGHINLRKDNECQNCGYTVEVEYCSKCGQKNTETRQSFAHLAGHFAEDLTHYDGAFWKTLKYLIFRPGKLTIEYLKGHRMHYVPPVKLYIFVSFITFLLMSLLSHKGNKNIKAEINLGSKSINLKKEGITFDNEKVIYHSVKEYDSIQNSLPEDQKEGIINRWGERSVITVLEKDMTLLNVVEGFIHILPKVLFIYMPIFAFWLWLFHGKKRWMFFDHSIYTLHYFSFLLIIAAINILLGYILGFTSTAFAEILAWTYMAIALFYSIFYFFRSHRKMYGERKSISRLKVAILFCINTICISIVLVISFIYIAFNAH
ncbi:DUF3667 domain-containing protein [Flavobacterium cerinum]|uniref:DUF3667 domain-containing protein n=1 Tax=Flavobacterium cerinum TaxID=2502784 RepID=A0A444GLU9_9FLAO|nr:DUF3667 domain-containing protein [Flavobacterium cerinum]RWW91989.1 DUF3667 domain-containing protein [Flavobacterium cerinum]